MIAPSAFKGDPLGWLGNQTGHAFGVGALGMVYIPTMASFVLAGEFPPKWALVICAGIIYLAFELLSQGWRGADTVEDWIFVVGYGVFGSACAFSEVAPGNPVAAFDAMAAAPIVTVMAVHLAFGAWLRR